MNPNFTLIESYRDDELLRNKFLSFISQVFPNVNFKEWYEKGFWTDNYIPFSILHSDKIIANASVALLDVYIDGDKRKGIQIGAVGTLPEFRKQGLSRELMNYILKKFSGSIDLFFLYANETVLNFYPKFGFKGVMENTFISKVNFDSSKYDARKLVLNNTRDYSLLLNIINNSQPITKLFGAENYDFITMWHILNIYRNNLYYIKDENAIIIKEESSGALNILEVFYNDQFNIHNLIPKIIESNSIEQIKFYFPPDQLGFKYDELVEEDTGLFILGDIDFGSKPIRFPMTAIT